jgi:predicted cupin superfamily sugar epimerase
MLTASQMIELLDLQPLPVEGGHFRQTYRSRASVPAALAPGDPGVRPMSTAIYYLLTSSPDSFSAIHRLPSDEIYHFYLGDPVEMLQLHPGGGSELVVLGPDLVAGQHVQVVVPREVWQGSRLLPGGHFALLGTTMAPGFDERDYLAADPEELCRLYPERTGLIHRLTRVGA